MEEEHCSRFGLWRSFLQNKYLDFSGRELIGKSEEVTKCYKD